MHINFAIKILNLEIIKGMLLMVMFRNACIWPPTLSSCSKNEKKSKDLLPSFFLLRIGSSALGPRPPKFLTRPLCMVKITYGISSPVIKRPSLSIYMNAVKHIACLFQKFKWKSFFHNVSQKKNSSKNYTEK